MDKIDLKEFEMKMIVRKWQKDDYKEIIKLQRLCFPKMEPWDEKQFLAMIDRFPEGQIVVVWEGEVIASSSSLIVDYDLYNDWHDWKTISDYGTISTHNRDGDMLYGIEIMVHPEYRGMKLARRLYDERKKLVRELNLKGIVIGGRLPNYIKYKKEMTVYEYVAKVEEKTIYDPVLTTQLANGFEIKQLLEDYLPSDEDSAGWATHMEWTNVDFRPFKKRSLRPVQIVRLAAVQYQMRSIKDFDEFKNQVDYFVDTASDYHCDFVVFPELFTLQILSYEKARNPSEAARLMADYTPEFLEMFTEMAVRYHINIIGGSMFVVENGKLYNSSFLFRRDGTLGRQDKIHVTPAEWKWWGLSGGDKVEVFDTDCGRVNIQICYDIEFPELSRIAAKKGANLIFIPFNTDERNGYLRVRHCAMARCIENHVYTVLAGCTGNLPQVSVADIHYAQSGIYTPADIPFSRDAVAAECTPNVETLILQDLDVELLRRHRYKGTTRNWVDRRKNLYTLHYKEGDQEFKI